MYSYTDKNWPSGRPFLPARYKRWTPYVAGIIACLFAGTKPSSECPKGVRSLPKVAVLHGRYRSRRSCPANKHLHQITRATKHNDSPSRRPHKISTQTVKHWLFLAKTKHAADRGYHNNTAVQQSSIQQSSIHVFFLHTLIGRVYIIKRMVYLFAAARKSSTCRHGLSYGVLETEQT